MSFAYLDKLDVVQDGRGPHAEVVRDEGEEAVGGVEELGLVPAVVVHHVLRREGAIKVRALQLKPGKRIRIKPNHFFKVARGYKNARESEGREIPPSIHFLPSRLAFRHVRP